MVIPLSINSEGCVLHYAGRFELIHAARYFDAELAGMKCSYFQTCFGSGGSDSLTR